MFSESLLMLLMFSLTLSSLIGGESGSTTMAPSHSAGILTPRRLASISAVAIVLGGLSLGRGVARTIGKDLVPPEILSKDVHMLCYYINSTFYIALAVLFKVPIATTHMVVLTVVSIGIHTGGVNLEKFRQMLVWWFATPSISFLLGYLFERFFYHKVSRLEFVRVEKLFKIFVVASGAYFAFSAGANNLGNSMGIVLARMCGERSDFVLGAGALSFGLGAVILSPRIMRMVGEGIFKLGVLRATVLQILSGTIILVASALAIPVSINETISSGMIGVLCAREGFRVAVSKRYIMTIAFFWFVVPILALSSGLVICHLIDVFL